MTTRSFVLAFLVAAGFAVSPSRVATQQAPRTLSAPNATFDEPFSSIGVGTVRELSDGRVIVADARDKVVQLLDFRRKAATGVGREGSGPGEFGLPMRVFAAPNDTTLLYDPLNQRYLRIAPDGKPTDSFRMELPASRGPGGMMVAGLALARGTDARGRLYMETPGVSMGPNGPVTADSAAILRYDRRSKQLDTLAMVKLQKSNFQVSGNQGNMSMVVGGGNPLNPRDEWTVFPDGRVAIVRAEPYRVDWVMPDGSRRTSPAIRHTPIRITDADKKEEEAVRNAARQGAVLMTATQGQGGTQRSGAVGVPTNAPALPPITDWPAVKPPFRAGQASVLARPNGELWVRKLEAAGAKGSLYDVIDAQGVVTHQLRVAAGWTVVGFGNSTVYTITRDADDLVYLQRHALP